jgi:serine/threonine protein kinase
MRCVKSSWNSSVGFLSFQICIIISLQGVNGISYEESNNGNDGGTLSTIQTIAISFGAMTAFVMCSICTWSWWRRVLTGRSGNVDVERAEYHEDIGYSFRSAGFDTLNPRNLSTRSNGTSDRRVHFEPLPTLRDLNIEDRGSIEMQMMQVPMIAIHGDNESTIYASDWFEDPTRQNFPRKNIEYVKEIGRGWFGKVLEAKVADIMPVSKSVRAIVQELRDDSENRDQMKFLHYARFYRDVNHENILRLLGYCIERSPYMLIYQNWPLGDLKHYLITNEDRGEIIYNQGTLMRMSIDIARALEFMTHAGYIHGDLSARNCLVGNTNGKVIIGDYGLATQHYRDDYYWVDLSAWPIRWAAPESLRCTLGSIAPNQITAMCNVWTFGIVLWEIFEFGKTPYPDLTDDAVIEQVLMTKTYILEPPRTPFLTSRTKDSLYAIMLSCWNTNPEDRPTISNILDSLAQPSMDVYL